MTKRALLGFATKIGSYRFNAKQLPLFENESHVHRHDLDIPGIMAENTHIEELASTGKLFQQRIKGIRRRHDYYDVSRR